MIRTTGVSADEIDHIMTPEDLARQDKLEAEIKAIEKERPKPIPMATGVTDGDYRFTPDGPGDEPAPGKGVKQRGRSRAATCITGPGATRRRRRTS